jgi:hypothetical protein
MLIRYSSNNSGGNWWLTDSDWLALEKAGWEVEWFRDADPASMTARMRDDGGTRFLGALANYASKEFETPREAMREFEEVTGQIVTDEGCTCCGAPHSFSWETPERGYASGEDCLEHLYEVVPESLREATELLNRRVGK